MIDPTRIIHSGSVYSSQLSLVREQSFLNLSPKECLAVYHAVLENGELLFDSAKLLASKGRFGIAISISILGVEEWIKGTVLLMQGRGVRVSELKEFRSVLAGINKTPHDSSSIFELLNLLIAIPERLFQGAQTPELTAATRWETIFDTFFGSRGAKTFDNIEWWSKADQVKNHGFCVEFGDGLLRPQDVSQEAYERAHVTFSEALHSLRIFHERLVDQDQGRVLVKLLNDGLKVYNSQKAFTTAANCECESSPWPEYIPQDATKLVLGTFPEKQAKRLFEFYFAGISNRFWRMMANMAGTHIFHFSGDEAVIERKHILDKLNTGILNIAHKVLRRRDNALDECLFPTEFSDVFGLLEKHPKIDTIILTSSGKGNSALNWFTEYCELNGATIVVPKGNMPRTGTINLSAKSIKVVVISSPSRSARMKDSYLLRMYSNVIL
jgi:AbiV family abortive infection protein